jgi:putative GTP pyrophosphokinase
VIPNWKEILIVYEQAVDELKLKFKRIRKEFRAMDEYSPIEFVTGRVKEINSIINKANLRGIPLSDVETGIEDIAGIRIMCQFEDDIHRVVDLIKSRYDMEVVEERDYVTNHKESGYRSYHLIIRYRVNTAHGVKPVLAEIQIRTLAMNFWATIEHSLNYKFDQQIPEHISERLQEAAEAVYNLDRQMSQIREEIMDAQELFASGAHLVEDSLNMLQNLYMSGNVDEIDELYDEFMVLQKKGNLKDLREFRQRLIVTTKKQF